MALLAPSLDIPTPIQVFYGSGLSIFMIGGSLTDWRMISMRALYNNNIKLLIDHIPICHLKNIEEYHVDIETVLDRG